MEVPSSHDLSEPGSRRSTTPFSVIEIAEFCSLRKLKEYWYKGYVGI